MSISIAAIVSGGGAKTANTQSLRLWPYDDFGVSPWQRPVRIEMDAFVACFGNGRSSSVRPNALALGPW